MRTRIAQTKVLPAQASRHPATTPVSAALGNLRAFVILMVLAQHAMMAYHPLAPPASASLATEPRSWLAFPIVDRQRSNVFLALLAFDDVAGTAAASWALSASLRRIPLVARFV